ncbi:hypothetical protein KEM48_013876 [Puccinia striiformis f. sp. tritici PST-130]|nr:hypothetical protein KEM48_013876 [Puccinia striiformis f. sp. tritici PST-130]
MQSALTMANTCGGACFGAGGAQFGNTAMSTLSQFSQLIQMLQSSSGSQFGSMIAPFAGLGNLSQFVTQASPRNPASSSSPPPPCNKTSSPLFRMPSLASSPGLGF